MATMLSRMTTDFEVLHAGRTHPDGDSAALIRELASRPDGQVKGGALAGAQSDYPFNRAYMHSGN